jgi:hypothetical protein
VAKVIIFGCILVILVVGAFVLRKCLTKESKPKRGGTWEMKRKQKYDRDRAKEARYAKYRD